MTEKRKKHGPPVPPSVPPSVPPPVPPWTEEETSPPAGWDALTVDDKIASLKERFGQDEQGVVRINRRAPDGTLKSLISIPVDTFDSDVVARKYGGGTYLCRFDVGREHRGSITLVIDESVKPEEEEPAAMVATGAPHDIRSELDYLRGKIEGLTLAQGKGGNGTSSAQELAAIVGVIAPLMKQPAPVAPVASPVSELREVLGLARDLGGEARPEKEGFPWRSLFDKVEPLVSLLVEQGRAGVMPGQVVQEPTAVKPPPLPNPPQPGAPTVPIWQVMVEQQIPKLIECAQKNRDPGIWAAWYTEQLREKVPATYLEQIQDLAATPDAVNQGWLKAFVIWPQLAPYESWMKEFLQALVAELNPPEEEEEAVEVVTVQRQPEKKH